MFPRPCQTILFKARGSREIGFGHISRCLALIRALPDTARGCLMVNHDATVIDFLKKQNVDFLLENDFESLSHLNVDRVIYDQFGDDDSFFSHIRERYHGAIVGLDYQNMAAPKVDVIVTLFNHAAPQSSTSPASRVILRDGLEYAIIADRFKPFRHAPRLAADQVKRLIVIMGGADPNALTVKAAKLLKNVTKPLEVDFIIGPLNAYATDVREAAGALSLHSVRVLESPGNIPELMNRADAAISGCATTFFELSYLGVPAMVMAQNPMESRFCEYLEQRKLALYARQMEHDNALATFEALFAKETRQRLVQTQQATFDGQGPKRILHIAGVMENINATNADGGDSA